MKIDEPETMLELRRIREKIYEETKDMTTDELIAYHRRKAKEVMDEYGIVPKKRASGE